MTPDRQAYELGYREALDVALHMLDGHDMNFTAHDRIRSLRACGECDHQPERHADDGACLDLIGFPGKGHRCPCVEYELVAP